MNPAHLASGGAGGLLAAVDPWILGFSSITVIVTIWMGFWAAKKSKTASDFFVAGRGVSVGWNSAAISGEYLSAASFMGVAGMVMSSGYDALWYPVCYACGYLFLLLFIAGPLRRFGAYTIPDFAEGRYDSPLFRKIAVIFVLCICFFYTMPQMKGAGVTLSYIFPGLPYWVGVALVGAIITFNVALGGMKGITLVQAFQYWIKMFSISVPVFVLMAVYGSYGKQVGVNGGNIERPTLNVQLSTNTVAGALNVERSSFPESIKWVETTYATRGSAGNVVSEALMSYSEWKQKHHPNPLASSFPASPQTGCSIHGLLNQCMQVSGKRYFLPLDIAAGSVNFGHSNTLNGVQWVAAFESALLTGSPVWWDNGKMRRENLALYHKDEDTIYVLSQDLLAGITNAPVIALGVQSSKLNVQRLPLPEKAPKDDLWLAPFGPLTTKAAKASNLSPEDTRSYALLYTYSLIIALVCGTAGLPHILVRFYTNPDGVSAKKTTMWVMILIGVFYVFPPVLGVMGRNLMPELYSGVGAKGTDKIVLELPRMLNEKVPHLGSILSGITCAGAFAAFMSTFSGLLVSMTGALAHDVYGRILRPKSTAEDRMRMFKWCAILVGGVAVLLGSCVEKLEINFMVGQAFAIAASSYFPLLFMSVWWRGMTLKGAAAGMLTGGVLAVVAISLTSFSTLAAGNDGMAKVFSVFKPLGAFWVEHPLIRILCEQPALWAVPLAIITMIVVSKLTSKDIPKDIRKKMLVLHAPEKLGLKQEYIQEQEGTGH